MRGEQDDLLIAMLCELGERILAMRELLAEPALTAKPHARAMASLLARGLDAVEARLQRDVQPGEARPAALHALDDCGRAVRALHARLGLLELRWSAAPLDIGLRKLRDDSGAPLRAAVVLTDDYAVFDDGVVARLRRDLAQAGLAALHSIDAAVVALPRLEAANPLAWPLVFPALARLAAWSGPSAVEHDAIAAGNTPPRVAHVVEDTDARLIGDLAAARLGGPAFFAARAASALFSMPAERPAWPLLAPVAAVALDGAEGLEKLGGDDGREGDGFARSGPVALFTRLARERDALLGHTLESSSRPDARSQEPGSSRNGRPWPGPLLPTADEAEALLGKLAAGIPINAIDPPVPAEFLSHLDAVDGAESLYALISPLGERPASLATILGVGWLYKVRYSYPLFRHLLRTHGSLGAALAAYRPHMIERDELLLQSIEASHVQGIFNRGKVEDDTDHRGRLDDGSGEGER